ncbi:MAG: hypothetical protein RIC29_13610 [Rhodospirillaceae bacterium]
MNFDLMNECLALLPPMLSSKQAADAATKFNLASGAEYAQLSFNYCKKMLVDLNSGDNKKEAPTGGLLMMEL